MSEDVRDTRPLFNVGVAVALVLVSVFAFSAFVTLGAFAPSLQRDLACRANVYSKCAVGFAGLEEAVRLSGAPTLISRSPIAKTRTQGLLIVTPEMGQGSDVASAGFGGPVLVVLPKWMVSADPKKISWGLNNGPIPPLLMPKASPLDAVKVARADGVARPVLGGVSGTPFQGLTLRPGPIEQLQTLSAPGWQPVLVDQAGNAVIAQAGSAPIYVLSDPDLLDTQGLANADTFAAAAQIVSTLRAGDGPVMFDATLNGYQLERNPLQLMFTPPFLPVTLCAVAAMALAGLQAFFRFGPTRRPVRAIALGKEALTDNSAQLIRLAGREARMTPGYAEMTRRAAAHAVGAPPQLTGQALTDFLDRLAARRGLSDSLASLTHDASRLEGRAGVTALAQRLYRWRLEMTRERQ